MKRLLDLPPLLLLLVTLVAFTSAGCPDTADPMVICEEATIPARNIARWNGSSWSSLGSGLDGNVMAIAVDPATGDVYAGGTFERDVATGKVLLHVARYSQSTGQWHPLGRGVNGTVTAIVVKDGEVFVGGSFAQAFDSIGTGPGVPGLAKWNGSRWSAVGSIQTSYVTGITRSGDSLLVTGRIGDGGGVIHSLSTGTTTPLFAKYLDGVSLVGGHIYASGRTTNSTSSGHTDESYILDIDRETLAASTIGVPAPTGEPYDAADVETLLDWNGRLIAGGHFVSIDGVGAANLASWDSTSKKWSPLVGTNGRVHSLTRFGDKLAVGGWFDRVGGRSVAGLAFVDMTTGSVSTPGRGLCIAGNPRTYGVSALAVHGNDLYVGGRFEGAFP